MAQSFRLPVVTDVFRHRIALSKRTLRSGATQTQVLVVFTGDVEGAFYVLRMARQWENDDMAMPLGRGFRMDERECPLYTRIPEDARPLSTHQIAAFWASINAKAID